MVKVTAQGHKFIRRLQPNHRSVECLSSPSTYYHITKGLFIPVPFSSISSLEIKDKVKGKKKKTQFEKTKQLSEPDLDKAEMLAISDQELKQLFLGCKEQTTCKKANKQNHKTKQNNRWTM